jgi:hypothetical protein
MVINRAICYETPMENEYQDYVRNTLPSIASVANIRSYSSSLCWFWHVCILAQVHSCRPMICWFWHVCILAQVHSCRPMISMCLYGHKSWYWYELQGTTNPASRQKIHYLLLWVLRTSFRGARRPLTREPEVYLKADITEANLSKDFSDICE